MARILIVDDDVRLRHLLKTYLAESGFEVVEAGNAAEARSMLALMPMDLMVLDIMMEGEDGLTLTHSLREDALYTFPILLLTARDTTHDCVKGLDTGADDYMTKPFEPEELLARLRSLLRRSRTVITHTEDHRYLNLGGCIFDRTHQSLMKDGEPVFLTSSEHILLCVLAQSPGKPFTRQELAKRIGHMVGERTVDVQIVRLRRKIESDPQHPRYIQTVRHIGYGLYPEKVSA